MRELERQVLLQVMDRKWREHLYEMDYLKEGIGLRAMAQRDPLIEYQREGFDMFAAMLEGIKEETVGHLFNVRVQAVRRPRAPASPRPTARRRARSSRRSRPGRRPGSSSRQPRQVRRGRADHPRPRAVRQRRAAGTRRPRADPDGHRRAAHRAERRGSSPGVRAAVQRAGRRRGHQPGAGPAGAAAGGAAVRGSGEPARNRPCPCGSGRKYKHCHGMPTAARPVAPTGSREPQRDAPPSGAVGDRGLEGRAGPARSGRRAPGPADPRR